MTAPATFAPIPTPTPAQSLVVSALPDPVRTLVEKLLEAHREGQLKACYEQGLTLDERGCIAQLCAPLLHLFAPDAATDPLLQSTNILLQWSMHMLRLRQAGNPSMSDAQLWLELPTWRPMLALLAHYRFVTVPDFPGIYTHRRGAPVVDHLCGLWYIGPSSFYRYVEAARQRVVQLWREQIDDGRHLFQLLDYACMPNHPHVMSDRAAQHRGWAEGVATDQPIGLLTALWHWHRVGDYARWAEVAHKHLPSLAMHTQATDLIRMVLVSLPADLAIATRTEVLLIQIALHRARSETELELAACVSALHAISPSNDALASAAIYAQLGKHYEFRDPDRSFAYYQEALRFCEQRADAPIQPRFRATYVVILVKLAWLYVNRNDPRAKALLDRAHASYDEDAFVDPVKALYEQAMGEYLRHQGMHQEALSHKLRALILYERLNDEEGQIKTFINLGNTYDDLGQYEQAIQYYQRVLQRAAVVQLAPDLLATAALNLGVCYFWLKQYDQAIAQYGQALDISQPAGLTYRSGQAHYNLAEAYYVRWIQEQHAADERRGDQHAELAYPLLQAVNHPSLADGVKSLKRALLAGTKQMDEDRLLEAEQAAHFVEHQEISQQRKALGAATTPIEVIQTRLTLADAYLRISLSERQEALDLAHKHDALALITPELDRQRHLLEGDLTQQRRIADRWKAVALFIDEHKQAQVLTYLNTHGHINKSGYAELCSVSLATASKHLAQLEAAGLLVQAGRGPATRYTLNGSTGEG